MGDGMRLACSRGIVRVATGDCFWAHGAVWRVELLTSAGIYSPSGLGGTPGIWCRVIHGRPSGLMAKYADAEGVEWCGDSVAAACYDTWHGFPPWQEHRHPDPRGG